MEVDGVGFPVLPCRVEGEEVAELEGEVAVDGVAEDEDEVGDIGNGLVSLGFAGEVVCAWFAGGGVVFAEEVDGGAVGDDAVDGDEEDGGDTQVNGEFHKVSVS